MFFRDCILRNFFKTNVLNVSTGLETLAKTLTVILVLSRNLFQFFNLIMKKN